MSKNSFHKSERLKSRKSIEYLFKEGSVLKSFPFVMLYREVETGKYPVLMTVAVPKKSIRNATDRNLIKRRTRESYRLLKTDLYHALEIQDRKVELIFLYQSKKIEDYRSISASVGKLVKKLTGL